MGIWMQRYEFDLWDLLMIDLVKMKAGFCWLSNFELMRPRKMKIGVHLHNKFSIAISIINFMLT